jgi:hypothetical protein
MVSQNVTVMKLKLKLKSPFADLKHFSVIYEVRVVCSLGGMYFKCMKRLNYFSGTGEW